jgi:hypothetical protein
MPGEVNIAMTREHHNMKSALLVFGSALLLAAVTAPADGKIVKNGDTIVLVGDSITQYGAKSETGYVQLFVRGLKATGVDFKWIGAGIAGNKSTDMRNRFDADVLAMPSFGGAPVSHKFGFETFDKLLAAAKANHVPLSEVFAECLSLGAEAQ